MIVVHHLLNAEKGDSSNIKYFTFVEKKKIAICWPNKICDPSVIARFLSCFVVTLQFFFSSPNVDIFQVRPSSMSLKFIKNRTLPSTEPWRTPHFTLNQGDGAPFRTTFCFPSKMVKFSIQLWILQVTPYEGSSLGNSCWGTFSNDFWKLWYITYAGFSSIYYLKKN